MQVVQRWILARLRNRRFFSLAEFEPVIRELVDQLNDRPMRGWGTTQRALFEQLDRPALQSLPPMPYEYAEKRCRVNLDYHIEIAKQAIATAEKLFGNAARIEVWDGERPVCLCFNPEIARAVG